MAGEDWGERAIRIATGDHWLGHETTFLEEVGSTNDWLRRRAEAGAPAGTLVLADYQSRGRGRMARRWEAPPGTSLLCSLLFRPYWPAERAMWLAMIAGLAAVAAIEGESALSVGLKWPNDIMVNQDGWRKVGGLLVDTRFEVDKLAWAVLGTGINVNIGAEQMPETETPATSLWLASGSKLSRLRLLTAYLRHLEDLYAEVDAGQSPVQKWRARLVMLGQPIRSVGPGTAQPVEGIAEDVDETGRLLVRLADGHLQAIGAGDVTLRG